MNIQSYDDFIEHYYVSHETFKKFLIYHKLLIEWQKKINLVSNSSVKNSLCRHFLDSAQLYKLLRKSKGAVLDFGSGAGFPGLVLAIMGIKNVHLVERTFFQIEHQTTLSPLSHIFALSPICSREAPIRIVKHC